MDFLDSQKIRILTIASVILFLAGTSLKTYGFSQANLNKITPQTGETVCVLTSSLKKANWDAPARSPQVPEPRYLRNLSLST